MRNFPVNFPVSREFGCRDRFKQTASATTQSPLSSAASSFTVAGPGIADAGGRHVVQTMPPAAGLNIKPSPRAGVWQTAHASRTGL